MLYAVLITQLVGIGLILWELHKTEKTIMALDQAVLDAIAQEKNAVDSVIAAIKSGAIGGKLSDSDKQLLVDDLNSNRDNLNSVLPANVTPPPAP